jgi:hypothetical protein
MTVVRAVSLSLLTTRFIISRRTVQSCHHAIRFRGQEEGQLTVNGYYALLLFECGVCVLVSDAPVDTNPSPKAPICDREPSKRNECAC